MDTAIATGFFRPSQDPEADVSKERAEESPSQPSKKVVIVEDADDDYGSDDEYYFVGAKEIPK